MTFCPVCKTETPAPAEACANCHTPFPDADADADAVTELSPPSGIVGELSQTHQQRSGSDPIGIQDRQKGPLSPGQSLGKRYSIIALLGAGGMGAVYRAWDSVLQVVVALKVIRSDKSVDPDATRDREARFKKELLLARRVTHKNVVRIHDIGEIDGVSYITMPYVEGENLADALEREEKLSVPRTLAIARQIAAGLAAAHEADVVHRDLKPANIMVTSGGEALITDFGIARAIHEEPLEEARAASPSRGGTKRTFGETIPGTVVGTWQYMAPEQAKGEPVDERADVYALGLILRQMLLGREWAGHPGSDLAEILAHMEDAPPSLHEIDPTVPSSVDRIVRRCLQADPGERYESAAAVLADLERLDETGRYRPQRVLSGRLLAAAAGVGLLLVAGTWWLVQPPPVVEPPDPFAVLVADFANETGETVFDGALEQAMSIALEGASFLTTFPRERAHRIAEQLSPGEPLDEEIARLVSQREGIKVVLGGSIRTRGEGYEIEARALDAARVGEEGAEPLASERAFASSRNEVLSILSELARRVRAELGDAAPRAASAETFTASSLPAMSAYARAQQLNFQGSTEEALEAYREAVELDPRLGRAHAGLGALYHDLGQSDQAEASYQEALRHLDRMTERERYRTLGGYYLGVARNFEKAIENYEALVRLYPADNTGHANLALAYLLTGDVAEAVEEGRRAVEIYPGNILQRTNYAMYAMYASDFETAIEEAERVLESAPEYDFALLTLALSRAATGDMDGAREAYDDLAEVGAFGASLAAMGRADLAMFEGSDREAVELLRPAIELDREQDRTDAFARKHVALAEAYRALGEGDRAAESARAAAGASDHEGVLFPAALVLLDVGHDADAERIVERLGAMIQTQPRSYASLLRGEMARRAGRHPDAIDSLRTGLGRHDSWFTRYLLGLAYLDAGHPVEALAELELCAKRRGETTDAFFADTPTLRYLPQAYYWLGIAQEATGASAGARTSFERFLALRGGAEGDPRLADASERLEALSSPR